MVLLLLLVLFINAVAFGAVVSVVAVALWLVVLGGVVGSGTVCGSGCGCACTITRCLKGAATWQTYTNHKTRLISDNYIVRRKYSIIADGFYQILADQAGSGRPRVLLGWF